MNILEKFIDEHKDEVVPLHMECELCIKCGLNSKECMKCPTTREIFDKALRDENGNKETFAPEWIFYDEYFTSGTNRSHKEWEYYFKKIEKVLGFKLFKWQKRIIANGGGLRCTGLSTAYAIKILLDPNEKVVDYTVRPRVQDGERQTIADLRRKFKDAGIKTNVILLTHEEKRRYKEKLRAKKRLEEEFKKEVNKSE